MSDGRVYRGGYARPYRPAARSSAELGARRSHAAVPVALAVVLVGLYLARYTFLAPGVLGVVLLLSGLSFLSTRINPLSPHFYLVRKPSWLAVGVVFLGALVLLYYTYTTLTIPVGLRPPGL